MMQAASVGGRVGVWHAPSRLLYGARSQMDKTQSDVARLLRVDDQTVARWEKKKSKIPGQADLGLRMLFLNSEVAQPEGNEILTKLEETISSLVEEDAPLME